MTEKELLKVFMQAPFDIVKFRTFYSEKTHGYVITMADHDCVAYQFSGRFFLTEKSALEAVYSYMTTH